MTTEATPGALGSNDQLGAVSEARCMCKGRAASACPGEWEPGCDLGNNPAHVLVHQQTPDEREALDTALGLWVCPWRICNTKQAQECRAATAGGKRMRGCGAQFAKGVTLEQARQQINWRGA